MRRANGAADRAYRWSNVRHRRHHSTQPFGIKSDRGRTALVRAPLDLGAAFISVDPPERSTVKIVVDGVAARIAEAIDAIAILLWLKQTAPNGVLPMPLDTNWIGWVTRATVAVWLLVTQKLRVRIDREQGEPKPAQARDIECERFPDECPCTTELGKGIA